MTYDPFKHHRRSIRLKGYNYTRAGAYFVTVVAQDRACLFGEVADGVMRLNDAGRMVQTLWDELPVYYPGVEVDAFVVMPNHIHGIVVLAGADNDGVAPTATVANKDIVGAAPRGRPGLEGRPAFETGGRPGLEDSPARETVGRPHVEAEDRPQPPGQAQGPAPTATVTMTTPEDVPPPGPLSLADVIHRFKTMTTTRYIAGVKQWGWPGFRKRGWQRNYYEKIIRDEAALNSLRRYIAENPLRWDRDEENPRRAGR